jgi:hypothetical protein
MSGKTQNGLLRSKTEIHMYEGCGLRTYRLKKERVILSIIGHLTRMKFHTKHYDYYKQKHSLY